MTQQKTKQFTGVYETRLKNGRPSYRASVTHRGKHIALGSYGTPEDAHVCYLEAAGILKNPAFTLADYQDHFALPFDKCVSLVNFRDHGIYFANPILLQEKCFLYYLTPKDVYKFDIDDLFYYSSHRIMRRGRHLFVADYGSQVSVLSRFGLHSYSVAGRDYRFVNGDRHDLRYENIAILNRYHGVRQFADHGFVRYKTVIHIRSNYVVGSYDTEAEAAIAYNKAADILTRNGFVRNFAQNYVETLSPSEYAELYTRVRVSDKLERLVPPC